MDTRHVNVKYLYVVVPTLRKTDTCTHIQTHAQMHYTMWYTCHSKQVRFYAYQVAF